jgi:pimeloyl-ACP methyl ester carboxylesterase
LLFPEGIGGVVLARQDFVTGSSGVRLAVRVAGPDSGESDGPPILFLHGWAQSAAAWTRQLTGPLADRFRLVAADLRGHGDSDVPADGYDSAAEWAEDVRALLAYAGRPAVVVGWSYGGLVVTDYLRVHGTAGLAGIVLVGAITEIGRGHPGGRSGPTMRAALPDALSPDPAVAEPAIRAFTTGMSSAVAAHAVAIESIRPKPAVRALVDATLRVPAEVRAALFRRDVESAEVLAAVDVPTLVMHGTADAVVQPSAAEFAAATIPGAELRWFDRVGHLPFLEQAGEFDQVLLGFLDQLPLPERTDT